MRIPKKHINFNEKPLTLTCMPLCSRARVPPWMQVHAEGSSFEDGTMTYRCSWESCQHPTGDDVAKGKNGLMSCYTREVEQDRFAGYDGVSGHIMYTDVPPLPICLKSFEQVCVPPHHIHHSSVPPHTPPTINAMGHDSRVCHEPFTMPVVKAKKKKGLGVRARPPRVWSGRPQRCGEACPSTAIIFGEGKREFADQLTEEDLDLQNDCGSVSTGGFFFRPYMTTGSKWSQVTMAESKIVIVQ
jgi:hypothetical protein